MKHRTTRPMLWLFSLGRWLGRRPLVYSFLLGLESGSNALNVERNPIRGFDHRADQWLKP